MKSRPINRDLATLRRIGNCVVQWGIVSSFPRIKLLTGEKRRERALTGEEEAAYLKALTDLGQQHEREYDAALHRIRATVRGEQPIRPDAFRLRDIATLKLDAGLRPDECFRLKPENLRDGGIVIFEGKTPAARRRIPIMTERLRAFLDIRLSNTVPGGWLFSAPTKSGHVEASTIKKQHKRALKASGVKPFEPYVFRHTCLTNWAGWLDVFVLQRMAGQR